MSWEEDVAKRRWAYFVARRREFEDASSRIQTPNDARLAHPSESTPPLGMPSPCIAPRSAHGAGGRKTERKIILQDELEKVLPTAGAAQLMPESGDGVRSLRDVPIRQNLISSCHHASPPADVMEFAREHLSQEMEWLSETMSFPTEEDPLVHAYLCKKGNCHVMCTQLKRLIYHLLKCPERGQMQVCNTCNWTQQLFAMHKRICNAKDCPLPCCRCHRG